MRKKIINLALISALAFTMVAGTISFGTTTYAADKTWPHEPVVTFVTRNTIEFGSYPQYDKNGDGNIDWDDATPIKWQILDAADTANVLILADSILDGKKYNEQKKSITWENSDIREWLNSTGMNDNEGFYNTAFSASQKVFIKDSSVENADNPNDGTDGGDNTTDKVFLLSLDEIKNTSYKFSDDFEAYDQARIATVTDYAVEQGTGKKDADGAGSFWLRSPGYESDFVSFTHSDGEVEADGYAVNAIFGVRPALRINLQSANLEQAENQVAIKSVDYDTVTIGKNADDNDIVWNVLKVDGDKALLFAADSVSGKKAYNSTYAYTTTWENSDIRAWLNSDDNGFYKSAFTDAEREAILQITVENNVGDDTNDYVFLLSVEELTNKDYGFASMIRCASIGRQGEPYWTRSLVENDARFASYVWDNGVIGFGSDTFFTISTEYVRPAMWVDLTKLGYVNPNPQPSTDSNVTYKSDVDEKLTWTKGSGKDLTFTIKTAEGEDDSFYHFDSLKIDDKTLARGTDYNVTKGSTIITIKAATMEALELGEHTISVVFDNGIYETTLSIQAASPATGDGESIALTTCVLIAATAALSITAFARKAYKSR